MQAECVESGERRARGRVGRVVCVPLGEQGDLDASCGRVVQGGADEWFCLCRVADEEDLGVCLTGEQPGDVPRKPRMRAGRMRSAGRVTP